MPVLTLNVDDETFDELRKSESRSAGIRAMCSELRERRKHVCRVTIGKNDKPGETYERRDGKTWVRVK